MRIAYSMYHKHAQYCAYCASGYIRISTEYTYNYKLRVDISAQPLLSSYPLNEYDVPKVRGRAAPKPRR